MLRVFWSENLRGMSIWGVLRKSEFGQKKRPLGPTRTTGLWTGPRYLLEVSSMLVAFAGGSAQHDRAHPRREADYSRGFGPRDGDFITRWHGLFRLARHRIVCRETLTLAGPGLGRRLLQESRWVSFSAL